MTAPVPDTGHDEIDAALDRLKDLEERPVGEHCDRLTEAHETLHRVLHDRPGS